MENSKLKISVVTVSYNAADTIEETIQSVIDQIYDNIEYIIIDGGSTDGTVDIIKKYANRITYWISEPDKGIYDAMNKGIAIANGDYINFMNAGDKFVDRQILKNIFNEESNIVGSDIIYGNAIFAYPWGKILIKPRPLTDFKSFDPIFHQSSFTRLSLLKATPFDISYKIAGDYNFFYHSYIDGKKFFYLNIVISVFDAADGISSNAISLRLYEGLKVIGEKATLKYHLKKARMIFKFEVRAFIKKISPKLSNTLQKKLLLRNSRIIEFE